MQLLNLANIQLSSLPAIILINPVPIHKLYKFAKGLLLSLLLVVRSAPLAAVVCSGVSADCRVYVFVGEGAHRSGF